MKKILLFLLLLPALSWGTTNTIAGGKWSAASIQATDTVVVTGTTSNDTIDGAFTFVAYRRPAATTSLQVLSGTGRTQTLTGSGVFFNDSGVTGAKGYPDSICHTGTSGVFKISAGTGTITATTTKLQFNGTDTIQDNKGITFNTLTLGASAIVIINGTASPAFSSATTPLIFTNGGTLTINRLTSFLVSGNVPAWSILAGSPTFNGSAEVRFDNIGLTGTAITIPALTFTGSNNFAIRGNRGGAGTHTITQTGNLVIPTLVIWQASAHILTYNTGNFNITAATGLYIGNNSTGTSVFNLGSSTISCGLFNGSLYNNNLTYNMSTATITCQGAWTFSSNWTVTHTSDIVTLNGTATQTVTSNGKQFNDLTIINSGTATVKFADLLSLIGDLTLTDGRDSLGRVSCVDYSNSTNDSVFHTDTTIITGTYYRNNAKVSRVGGIISFRGAADGTINLVDAGRMGPFSIRKTGGKKISALSNILANRILDTIGVLKMGVYAVSCTTLTVRDTGLQCAAVTLDTLNSWKGGTLGGGTITRWNWLANGLAYTNTAATTLTVGSISGLGGAAGSLDSVISGTPGAMDTLSCPQDTPAYTYTKDQYMVNARYLPATSISGGNNRNVKTLSYTGVTKDVATGIVGTVITFTGPGFVGACSVKFGSNSYPLTVVSYTSANVAVPALPDGVYPDSVSNSDGDITGVGTFTILSLPVISYATPKIDTVGKTVSYSVTSTGGAVASYTLTSGTLVPTMALNASTGTISGTPGAAKGVTVYRITATNASGTGYFDWTESVIAAPSTGSSKMKKFFKLFIIK
jgi:hypothetical protein